MPLGLGNRMRRIDASLSKPGLKSAHACRDHLRLHFEVKQQAVQVRSIAESLAPHHFRACQRNRSGRQIENVAVPDAGYERGRQYVEETIVASRRLQLNR